MLHPFDLPENITLLITDELGAPADFLLNRILLPQANEPKFSKCLVLSSLANITRWKATAAKSAGFESIVFVDLLSEIQPVSDGATATFKCLLDMVSSHINEASKDLPVTIIVDEVSVLSWMGVSSLQIVRFCRALRAACLKRSSNLIIRHHIVTPGEPDDLFRSIFQLCSYHLEVRPLASGKSGAVSGEVALHAGPSMSFSTGTKLLPRSSALQYRLSETGAVFFERGTASGIL